MVTAMMTIVGVQNASAQASYNFTYTQGVEVAAGDNYFLYNIGAGQFLTNGMDWGTRGTVDHAGRTITITAAGESKYTLYSKSVSVNNGSEAKEGYVTTNGYVDTGSSDAAWVFTPVQVAGYTNAYTIKNSDTQYLYFNSTDCRVNVGNNTGNNYSYWILVPKSARDDVGDRSYYLQNAGFDRPWEQVVWKYDDAYFASGSSNWWDGNYHGARGGRDTNRNAEVYHHAFNVSQVIAEDVPNGKYIVSAQAFYRKDDNTNVATYLYANTDQQELAIFNGNGQGTVDNMNGASDAFTAGQYTNSVTTNVTDGKLTVGIKTEGTNNWVIFDNFSIKFIDLTVLVNRYNSLLQDGANLSQLPMQTSAKDALNSVLSQYATGNVDTGNEDELNAAISALEAAISTASTNVSAYSRIKAYLDVLTTPSQLGDIPVETAKADVFYTNYTNGNYANADEVLPLFKTFVANYWSTNTPGENADLTGFITNQGFEFGDMTSWTNTPSSDTGVRDYSNSDYNAANGEGAHLFNTWWKGTPITQSIANLPNGTYRLKVSVASDGATIYLTANGRHNEGTETGGSYPTKDTFQEATFDFVVTNGEATIGVVGGANGTAGEHKDYVADGYWWYKADNFRLTYLSAGAEVAPELVDAPMNAGIRGAQQTALDTWNANKTMDNYNALLAAIDAAQASADKYVIIDQRIPKLVGQSDGKVTEDDLKAKYTSGEYVEADDVFTEYRNVIAAYYATNAPAADDDLTEFIINPSFEFGDTSGWTHNISNDTGVKNTNDETYEFTHTDGDKLFNTWSNNNAFLYIVQELKGLPQGTYELSAVWAAYNNTQIEFTAENVQPDGSINEEKVSFKPYDSSEQADAHYGVEKTLRFYVTDGTLKIGGHAYGFFKCDNFKLKFISTAIDAVDTNQPMNRYERENYLDAITAYAADPTPENLRELIDRKLIAENSIEAYKAAKATLDRVLAMMSKTNVYTYEAYFTIDDMYRKYGPEEGFYKYETLKDDVAFDLERMFFGSGYYRNYDSVNAANPKWLGDIPAVPFIASAWDCGNNGYAYRGRYEGDKSWQEGDDYYANTWSTEGLDDGTHMLNPYLEYWLYGDHLLAPRTMTATIEGTPGAEYTVKMFVRVRTVDTYYDREWRTTDPNHEHPIEANMPKGMSIQIGNGTPVVPEWQFIDNCESYYKLNNEHQLWVCNLWDYAEGDLPKGYVDDDGKLRIKFIIGDDSNITWLSMKDVYVNYDGEDLTGILAQLQTEVDYANANYYAHLGFDGGEYAPYTNVDELIALKRAQQVHDASENYFLVKAAYDQLYAFNHGGENNEGTWTKNPEEMNGFYWTNDYTEADVQHVEWYGEEDDCITPSGWELIGRNDGFSTGIKKLGVNTDDEGMKAIEGETGLLTKYETDYGKETGYTLPLKAGVKYILTFTCAYLGEGEFPTNISLSAPRTGVSDVLIEPLTDTVIQPVKPTGEKNQGNWYMYRATFVPKFDADYVILFDKDNVDSEPVMMGELTLVRYKEDTQLTAAQRLIDGTNQAGYSYTPDYVGGNFQVTRSWNSGGGTANGAYNTLVLPFKLSGNELKAALGENFDGKVYYYTGATYTGGDSYYTLNFEDRESGIFANVPVLIWSAADSPLPAWSNKTFEKTVTKYVKNNLTVDTDIYDLVGTYETIKIPAGASYLTPDNKFKKSAGKANLAATRAYFIPFDKQGNVDSGAKLMGFSIDDVPTGIMAIEEDGELRVTSGNIYSVDGRLVRQNATTLEGLPRGTYIVDGKKYMVK